MPIDVCQRICARIAEQPERGAVLWLRPLTRTLSRGAALATAPLRPDVPPSISQGVQHE